MNFFNPKLKDMMDENPDQTVIGFAWAISWRLQVVVLAIYIAFLFLCVLLFS